jgi:hypothetical protein
MIDTIALPALAAAAIAASTAGPAGRPRRETQFAVEQFGPGQPGRGELEAFIADSFLDSYGAEVSHFCDVLLGCRDADGHWIAALGYTLAADGPTFLEQYLDAPLEAAIGARAGDPVARADIVEVGNLASIHPGAARALIVSTTRRLHGLGLRWVAFTATVSLLNSFTRLRLQPQVLAAADPARLADAGQRWGSYYDTQPKVMFGDIRYGYAQLN